MDAADAWGRTSSSSSSAAAARRLQSRYDLYMGFDDADAGGDDLVEPRGGAEPYNCPFCGEDFDFVGLCCHIDDEHAVEANTGLCPICATRVGMDLIGHLTMQHGSYFKMQRRRRVRKISSGSHSLLSLLRKDLRDGSLQSFLGGSSYVSNPPAAAPDPFLSSLVCNFPVAERSKDLHTDSSDNNFLLNKFPGEQTAERYVTSSLYFLPPHQLPLCHDTIVSELNHLYQRRIRMRGLKGANLFVGLCSRLYLMMITCKGDHQPLEQPHSTVKEHKKDNYLHFSNLVHAAAAGHMPFMVRQEVHQV